MDRSLSQNYLTRRTADGYVPAAWRLRFLCIPRGLIISREYISCRLKNFPTQSSRHTRCANHAPAASLAGSSRAPDSIWLADACLRRVAELARRYAETIVTETEADHRATQELIRDYVLKNFTGEKNGQRPRVLFLIFRGPDAVEKIHRTVGHISA